MKSPGQKAREIRKVPETGESRKPAEISGCYTKNTR